MLKRLLQHPTKFHIAYLYQCTLKQRHAYLDKTFEIMINVFTLCHIHSFGRKPILYISAILQLVFGLACAFMPQYYFYAATLFFYGCFGSGGAYVTGFVLCKYFHFSSSTIQLESFERMFQCHCHCINHICYPLDLWWRLKDECMYIVCIEWTAMELVGPSRRTICGTMFSVTFAIGVMVVAFWAWLIPNDQLLQIIYASHSILLLGHWWWVLQAFLVAVHDNTWFFKIEKWMWKQMRIYLQVLWWKHPLALGQRATKGSIRNRL